MARPEFTRSRNGAAKSNNPFAAWAARRKEAKRAAAEEAARTITNDTAKNEAAIVEILASIDFLHSKLPKEVLEAKKDPNRNYCDLEYAARVLQQLLIKNPQAITVDIRSIDERLYQLARRFKDAVEQGDEQKANAARAGLARGIEKIRNRVPAIQPEMSRLFVESSAKYLDSWLTLVDMSQGADIMQRNVERQRQSYADEKQKDEKATAELFDRLKGNAEYNRAFREIREHDSFEERSRWDDTQREVHVMLVKRRMGKARLNLKNLELVQGEMELEAQNNAVNVLKVKVDKIPVLKDPNEMNKYREQIDELFNQLAESDAAVDESLKLMDEIDGRIEQLSNAPGAVRAREVAVEEAERAIEDIRQLQLERAGLNKARAEAGLRELGVYSNEELRAMQRELAEQEAREEQELVEELQDTEGEFIYN